jgi:hypothetical protein
MSTDKFHMARFSSKERAAGWLNRQASAPAGIKADNTETIGKFLGKF